MDVEEVKKRRRNLEIDIEIMINEFIKKTGVTRLEITERAYPQENGALGKSENYLIVINLII